MSITASRIRKSLWNSRWIAALVLAAVAGALSASNATACADPTHKSTGPAPRIPFLPTQHQESSHEATIVGLWQTHYTQSNGDPFIQSFKQWHADGLEWENAFLPVLQGNVCYGVYKQIGARKVKLHHVAWTFDPSMPADVANGTFTIDEIDTVAPNGMSYTGNFTFQTYDVNGNPNGPAITGTIVATRITVPNS